jgi:hypothetical protein
MYRGNQNVEGQENRNFQGSGNVATFSCLAFGVGLDFV